MKKPDDNDEKVLYTYDDFVSEYGSVLAVFNAYEFSHNKIELATQQREEKDVFDVINKLMQLQRSLSSSEEMSTTDLLKLLKPLFSLLNIPEVQEVIKLIGERIFRKS